LNNFQFLTLQDREKSHKPVLLKKTGNAGWRMVVLVTFWQRNNVSSILEIA